MKKWIIIIASVATVLIASLVVCLGLLNREPQVEVTAGEYFEGIAWGTSISDAKSKLSSERYDVLKGTFYTKSYFNGMEDTTAIVKLTPNDEDALESVMLMFRCDSEDTSTGEKALKQLRKAYEKAFDKLTDKKVVRDGKGTAAESAIGGWDECISWITENSCIEMTYTKDKSLTISYEMRGTEYSDFIESLIENK